ncbi:hypothetical protein PoB_001348500 [Plakobranchus ocellatus]|uniref:Uncharacterized protein n=1 Tax=Plakobranchus ocellatus TaxID=259542 RepID=A0AAV3YWY9_9GAST|nr:hypothetical protein PoB_001348500 [Plakobranchus ocellatus]
MRMYSAQIYQWNELALACRPSDPRLSCEASTPVGSTFPHHKCYPNCDCVEQNVTWRRPFSPSAVKTIRLSGVTFKGGDIVGQNSHLIYDEYIFPQPSRPTWSIGRPAVTDCSNLGDKNVQTGIATPWTALLNGIGVFTYSYVAASSILIKLNRDGREGVGEGRTERREGEIETKRGWEVGSSGS